ncbi:putative nuclear localization signal [Vigna unguiculata]|uniref:Ninja-family protein n=1 Tax=Vigna unguiculata TaxID=3917 RepID=A0A4D6NFX9_VIGUN|nr:putative nuclear localization signal [Vigna unguiculata]
MAQVQDRDNTRNNHHYISSAPATTAQSPMNNLPRDLLRSFMGVNNHHGHHGNHQNLPVPVVKLEEEEELELSLGLSMNGRFGVDPTAKKIKRTTSIPEFVRDEMGYAVVQCTAPLVRTCSLPTETEEEWRKRKELQTLRRMEARRKRSEKQRNLKALREQQQQQQPRVGSEGNNPVEQGAGAYAEGAPLGRTVSLTTRVCGLGLNGDSEKEKKEKGGVVLAPPSPSQGSIGSSGTSEVESRQGQGPTPIDVRSPTSGNLQPDSELKSAIAAQASVAENGSKNAGAVGVRSESNKHSVPQNRTKDIVRNLLEDMPCVSTKGDGPNGRRVEGFLYRYGKGEEVRIVCVCHGSFLTPSEFVKHAGGGDVANPLKHIVVSPSIL